MSEGVGGGGEEGEEREAGLVLHCLAWSTQSNTMWGLEHPVIPPANTSPNCGWLFWWLSSKAARVQSCGWVDWTRNVWLKWALQCKAFPWASHRAASTELPASFDWRAHSQDSQQQWSHPSLLILQMQKSSPRKLKSFAKDGLVAEMSLSLSEINLSVYFCLHRETIKFT